METKRTNVTPLEKPVKRLIDLNLPESEGNPAIEEQAVLALDPEHGVTLRLHGKQRTLALSVEKLVEVATPLDNRKDAPKNPNKRKFLLGR